VCNKGSLPTRTWALNNHEKAPFVNLDVAMMGATYCQSAPAQRLITEHYCMDDHELYLCSDLGSDARGHLMYKMSRDTTSIHSISRRE
jgi:hypothetical protein